MPNNNGVYIWIEESSIVKNGRDENTQRIQFYEKYGHSTLKALRCCQSVKTICMPGENEN
jgi:hypothetical protein